MMKINKDEIIKDPAALMAQVFYLMNMWAEIDMARMAGELDYKEESQTFSGLMKPLAVAYSEIIVDMDEDFINEVLEKEQEIRKSVKEEYSL